MPKTKTKPDRDIYHEVNSPGDIVIINERIRGEMDHVKRRDQLTELKKRADYLCALAVAPSWKEKFRDQAPRILDTAMDEDRKTTEEANRIARGHGWDADYDAWGEA